MNSVSSAALNGPCLLIGNCNPRMSADLLQDFLKDPSVGPEIVYLSPSDIKNRIRLIEMDVDVMRREISRLTHEEATKKEQLKDNQEKIKMNTQLPYMVAEVVEVLRPEQLIDDQETGQDGASVDIDAKPEGFSAVVRTTARSTAFLPIVGLVDAADLKPGDKVAVNKDSYLIYEKLPSEYDPRAKVMEVDERPTETYADIGGLDKQIQELVEAVVLPITMRDRFDALGIKPPKGVLMYGPPGTGKTLMARACAAQCKATFLKLAGPQLVQMYIGDGAKILRDAFAIAKEKAPAIIFIDEIDAIGTKRVGSDSNGDMDVQRTLLELLNQLDGFGSDDRIKVIAATNRVDTLDPALLRSGRLDRKIEFPLPNEEARKMILRIHSRKMAVDASVNFDEVARCCEDFNAAQCKAICVEAGMIAMRRSAAQLCHEDFMEGIQEVLSKKKSSLHYYA